MAGDLSDYGGHIGMQLEVIILREISSNSPEIDRWEEIL